MDKLLQQIAGRHAELVRLRKAKPHGLGNLEHVHDIELTYTSNAIEGNALTASETMLVIEKGITIGGKPLKDHLEAIDHHDAIRYVREIAGHSGPLTEMDVRTLHGLIVKRSNPDIAGRYASQGRFMVTAAGRVAFHSPAEIPAVMAAFSTWLEQVPNAPEAAFTVHRRLVNIHPFDDGNGRTARLLMNLILIRGAYPPITVRPEDRPAYIAALQTQDADDGAAFDQLLAERLNDTLAEYIDALDQVLPDSPVRPE